MEDIARRQRGFRYDEDKTKNHRDDSIGGVLGMSDAAPSILTSLARRRAGYTHMNTGLVFDIHESCLLYMTYMSHVSYG
jgi:hypothetical protein